MEFQQGGLPALLEIPALRQSALAVVLARFFLLRSLYHDKE
jgi:hypothetical protein